MTVGDATAVNGTAKPRTIDVPLEELPPIDEVPVVRDGEIVPGHRMSVNLACDHRILYGADGARFLARVRDLLEEPVFLAL